MLCAHQVHTRFLKLWAANHVLQAICVMEVLTRIPQSQQYTTVVRFVPKEPIVQRDHQNLFCVLQAHTTHSSEWETCKTALYVQSRLLTLNTVLKVATLVASSLIALRVLNNVVALERIVFIQMLTAHAVARQASILNLLVELVWVHQVI